MTQSLHHRDVFTRKSGWKCCNMHSMDTTSAFLHMDRYTSTWLYLGECSAVLCCNHLSANAFSLQQEQLLPLDRTVSHTSYIIIPSTMRSPKLCFGKKHVFNLVYWDNSWMKKLRSPVSKRKWVYVQHKTIMYNVYSLKTDVIFFWEYLSLRYQSSRELCVLIQADLLALWQWGIAGVLKCICVWHCVSGRLHPVLFMNTDVQ